MNTPVYTPQAIIRCACCHHEQVCHSVADLRDKAESGVSGRILALVRHLAVFGPVTLEHLLSHAERELNPRGGALTYVYVRVMVSRAHQLMTQTMAGLTIAISSKMREDKKPVLFFFAHPDSGWSQLPGMEVHNAMRDKLTD